MKLLASSLLSSVALAAALASWTAGAAFAGGHPCSDVSHCHFRPWLQNGSAMGSQMGYAVDLERRTAVVGIIGRNAVYVYEEHSGSWTQTQVIQGPLGSFFGAALELDGDRLVVGAPRFEDELNDEGRAFVYERRDGLFALKQTLTPPQAFEGGRFGEAVSLDGPWLAVGEPFAPEGGLHAYHAEGSDYELLQTVRGTEGNNFGEALDIDGQKLVVGDPTDDERHFNAGAAFFYDLGPFGLTLLQKFIPAPVDGLDFFGGALSLDGDRLAVSARGDDTAANNAGAVYVFAHEFTNVFPFQAFELLDVVHPCGASEGQLFGQAVDLSQGRLAVGASNNAPGLPGGSVYLFERRVVFHESWNFEQRLHSDLLQSGDSFGSAVALQGRHVLVGARQSDLSAPASGAAFFFATDNGRPGGLCPCDVSAGSRVYGQAVPGTRGEPELRLGSAPILGESVLVGLYNVEPGLQPFLWVSPTPSHAPFDPRRPLAPGSGYLAFPTVTGFGQVGLAWDVPSELALCGSEWHLMAFLADPGAPGPLHVAVSNSIRARLGF